MSGGGGHLVWQRAKDGYVLAFGILLLATLGIDYLPLLRAEVGQVYLDYYSYVPFLVLIVIALGSNVRHSGSRDERLFWTWCLLGKTSFLAAELASASFRNANSRFSGDLLASTFWLTCLLCALIAADQRQNSADNGGTADSPARMRQAGYWLIGLVLFFYFELIPATADAVHHVTVVPAWAAYLVLDIVVTLRYLSLAASNTSPRWRSIYGFFSLSFALWCISDGLNALDVAHVLDLKRAAWADVVAYLPFLPYLVATRVRNGVGDARRGPLMRSIPVESLTLRPYSTLLFLLPAMHIGLAIVSPMPRPVQVERGILIGSTMLVLYLAVRRERKSLNHLRVLADQKRGEAERLFELLFENAPDAYYMNDLKGNFVDGNPAAERLIGYSREELIGKNFATCGLLSTAYVCKVALLLAKNSLGMSIETAEEVVLNRRDGTPVTVEVTTFPVEVGGRTLVLGIARDVSQRRRVEEERRSLNEQLEFRLEERTAELKKAEARFRMLVEQSLAGIYLLEGPEGRVSYVNPRAAEIVGFAAEELVGKPAVEFVVEEDRAMMTENVRKRMEGMASSIRYTYRARHKDGTLREVEVHGARTDINGQPAILGVIIDITERKKAELALREAEEKYREIFDDAVVGIFQTTPDGRYLSANHALARMYGYESREDLMSTVQDIERQEYVDPSRRHELARLLERDGVVRDYVFEIYRKDGSHGWVSENSRAVRDATGKVIYYEGTQEDITDRKLLERQLLEAQKLEAIGHLAGGIAHDFNNILNIIMGYSQLLLEPKTSEALRQRGLSNILATSKRGAALTQQLLAFSRKQNLQLKVTDLNETLSGVREMLSRVMGEDIEVVSNTRLPVAAIMADSNQIERMIINLAINAREAMPKGGRFNMEISEADCEKLPLLSEPVDTSRGVVQLVVSDNGCGMDADTLSHIFEPFFTTKPRGKGTGLGLAQVYGIVKQCEGSITASSTPGEGTTFRIYFPMVEAIPEAGHSVTAVQSVSGRGTILLVEDESLLRDAIRIYLERSGYQLMDAETPARALEIAGTFSGHIDLLVTDVIMPGMNGRQLADALLATRPDLKVIYISGYSDDKIAGTGIRGSETMLVQKPFTMEELAARILEKISEPPESITEGNRKGRE